MPRVIWNTVTHASYGKSARTGSTARMWWSMLILGIKRSARQVSLAERAVEGVLHTALGLWLCVMSVLAAYHVQPIGRALLGLPAGVYVPATAWILTCVVVGVLHNAAFQLPATAMPLLLTVPVSRRAIAVVALATKAAHPSNFIIGAFLVVLWWFNIYTLQPLPEALAWLVAAILLYLSSWLLGVAVRTRNVQTTEPLLAPVWATTISGSVLTSLYLANYFGRWSIIVTVVLVSLASMMVLRRIEAVLQVDTRDATARVVSSSYFSSRPWQAMLQLQKRLLLRNPRARHLLTAVAVYGLLGMFLSAVGFGTDTRMFTVLGQSSLIVAAGLGYTGHSLRLYSTFFDGMMVWPNGLRSGVGSATLLGILCTIGVFATTIVLALVWYPQSLIWTLATGVYAIGVANYSYALTGTFETARFDIAASSFSMEGAIVARPLLINACTGLVLIAPFLVGFTHLYATIIGLVGLTGIACGGLWTKYIVKCAEHRRYDMSGGFRTM